MQSTVLTGQACITDEGNAGLGGASYVWGRVRWCQEQGSGGTSTGSTGTRAPPGRPWESSGWCAGHNVRNRFLKYLLCLNWFHFPSWWTEPQESLAADLLGVSFLVELGLRRPLLSLAWGKPLVPSPAKRRSFALRTLRLPSRSWRPSALRKKDPFSL
jgi:hypothetical protein